MSVITTATVKGLATRAGVADDGRRFRPNLLIEPAVWVPFTEDDWAACTVYVGNTAIGIDRKTPAA